MSGSKTFQDPRKTDNYDTLTIGIQKLSPMLICLLHRVLIDPTLSILPSIPKSPKDVYPLLFSSYNPRNCFVKLTVYLWKRTCVYKYKLINIFYQTVLMTIKLNGSNRLTASTYNQLKFNFSTFIQDHTLYEKQELRQT